MTKINQTLLLTCVTLLSSWAFANPSGIPGEVTRELQKFHSQGQPLSNEFLQEFPQRVHQMILEKERSFVQSLNGQCKETINVSFGAHIMAADGVSKEFEDGLVRVEASKCFGNVEPARLVQVSESLEFKKRAFPTLRNITEENGLTCETTSAPSVGKSNYCYTRQDLEKNEQADVHVNFMVSNNDAPQFDAPVFYREAFVSARRMGPQTMYYVLSYVRASHLSKFQKLFAKDYVAKVQNDVFTELQNSIQSRNGQ